MGNVVINQKKINDYTSFAFHFFEGYKIGEGLFFNTILLNAEKKYNRMRLNEFYFIFDALLGNGYLEIFTEIQSFVKLTQRGFDFLYGDEKLTLCISLNYSLNTTNKKIDEIYNELWNYIGKENDALYYVKGPLFYNAIRPFLPTIVPTYNLYTDALKKQKKSTSRVNWYRELFLQLKKDDVESFLNELSKAINSEIEVEIPESMPQTDIFDVTPISHKEQNENIPTLPITDNKKTPHVFISYAWEEALYDWVFNISNDLREAGIDCRIDQYQEFGADLVKFMRDEIRSSDRVLVILTPKYKEKAESGIGGASYEGSIMSRTIYYKQDTIKFIPLLRAGSFESSSPDFMSGRKGFDFSDDSQYKKELATLVKVLKGESIIKISSIGKN